MLRDGAPCAISRSPIDDSASVTTDFYDVTRTAPPSIGADEFDGSCMTF